MKHSFLFKSFIVAALATSVIFSASAIEAKVISVKGKVQVQSGTEWIAVNAGDIIQKGAVISTGFKSEAVLRIKDSTVTLAPLTRITVEQLAETPTKDETQMYLDSGNVSFNVKKSENKRVGFKVRTPAATASVRGTAGTVTAGGAISATEGLIAVGPAETSSPAVAGEPTSNVPAEGESTTFTSTTDVGGSVAEVPVFAGQSTKTDELTGFQSSPQIEKGNEANASPSSTATLASQETTHEGTSSSNTPDSIEHASNAYGSVSVTVQWQ